ncbi:MAG: hypothetical protein RH917_03340 [Lacipirellulaceae bacterium]
MSRDTQQIARLIQELLRLTKGRVGTRWLVLLGVLLVGYLVAAPALNQRFGWNLPVATAEQEDATPKVESREKPAGGKQSSTSGEKKSSIPSRELQRIEAIVAGRSTEIYTSPAGLRYTRSRADGHRIRHVMLHAHNEPDRPGPHGVFDANEPAEVLALIDEAYRMALRGENTKESKEDNGIKYEVNMGRRIGYVGGQKGARSRPKNPPARRIRLIVNEDRIITAFPIK